MGKKSDSSKEPSNVAAGKNLKFFMESNGISKEKMAESLGIEKNSLYKILSGTNAISGPYNAILLKEFACDLNFIYGGFAYQDATVESVGKIERQCTDMEARERIAALIQSLVDMLIPIDK